MKKFYYLFVLGLFFSASAFAQTGTISGTVIDDATGDAFTGVSVVLVELQKGDPSDIDGNYELTNIPYGTYTLRATFVGYENFETQVTVNSASTTVNISLKPTVGAFDEVIVTAFGLSREEKSIGYAVQDVSGDDLTLANESNIVGALAGKVSGVQVIGTSGANIGGSSKIRLRGTNGLSDGQPLFVVDGTPINNRSFSSSTRGRDFGNLAGDINLDDVESVSVLKGAAASALYGNRASNGVILITTKGGSLGENQPLEVNFKSSTTFDNVYILPEYQDEYAGGYTQNFIPVVDPVDGQTYNTLNYAADESWGPKMDGTTYRPWYSWYQADVDGDGTSEYGKTIPLRSNPDNVRSFFDTGLSFDNYLSISGGSRNATYRVSIDNKQQTGVMPNSELDVTSLGFNGGLRHNDKFISNVRLNYINTKGSGRPPQGYSPTQGNAVQSFNQWFQRQLDMDMLRNYRATDGTLTSWNIRSATDTRPLYWDSPFFSIYENVPEDSRDRFYGNYTIGYNILSNLTVEAKVHADIYDFVVEDRIATGGLEQDSYSIAKRSNKEINYEIGVNHQTEFEDFTFNSFAGANLRQERYNSLTSSTVGGLSTANYFNISASVDRPNVNSFKSDKDVRSIYGTTTIGWRDIVYADLSVRNDWSSALPEDENSYLYYGISGSFVLSELQFMQSQNILSFAKLRASVAQVGDDIGPYQIQQTYGSGGNYGSSPTQFVPNSINNSNLKAAISSDYEFGADLRFLDGNVRLDLNYYNSVREDEIISLTVPGSSGYNTAIVNAGEFTTEGFEVQLGATPYSTRDWNVDLTANWATSTSTVNKLADGLTSRQLERAFFGVFLFAREGEEWGAIVAPGFETDDNGNRIVNPNGAYSIENNKDLGYLLPDYTGGFRADVSFKNFNLGTFFEFQKGGQFYSITKMFNAYSGLGIGTVGDNTLGNPLRDPVLDSNGTEVTSVALANAASNSGGVLVEGVDSNGNPVAYLTEAQTHYARMFGVKENWLYDASYVKLREVNLNYNLPQDLLSKVSIKRASVGVSVYNALLIYSSVDGVDPSAIQNGTTGFSFWEGGGLPGTRSVSFNLNLSF